MTTVTLNAAGHPIRIEVDPADHIGKVITRGRTWYEHDLLTDARQRVHGPGTAIDVGAHIGNHSLWFAAACGLHVVALEPNPLNYQNLAGNVAANELATPDVNRAYIRTLPVAAGSHSGWGRVVDPAIPHNSGTASVARDDGIYQDDAEQIPITTLDGLGLDDVKLIKIDVEGAAVDVLAGAQRLLAEQSPVLYVEGDRDEIASELPEGYECFGEFAKTPTWGFSR